MWTIPSEVSGVPAHESIYILVFGNNSWPVSCGVRVLLCSLVQVERFQLDQGLVAASQVQQ